MKNEKINKVDDVYETYGNMLTNKIAGQTFICGLLFLGSLTLLHNGLVSNYAICAAISAPISVVLTHYVGSAIFDKNIRKFRESHKEYNLPKSILKVDYEHKKALKKVKKEQRQIKNDYIKKCEEVKREVTSPVHADLYYYEEPEKVKVKVKTR